jgi:hypothetical protein
VKNGNSDIGERCTAAPVSVITLNCLSASNAISKNTFTIKLNPIQPARSVWSKTIRASDAKNPLSVLDASQRRDRYVHPATDTLPNPKQAKRAITPQKTYGKEKCMTAHLHFCATPVTTKPFLYAQNAKDREKTAVKTKRADMSASCAGVNQGYAVSAENLSPPAEGGYVFHAAVPTDSMRRLPLQKVHFPP